MTAEGRGLVRSAGNGFWERGPPPGYPKGGG